jgi:hypothetical protein
LETIRILNAEFNSSDDSTPRKALGSISKVIYFRNMDITPEDVACLVRTLPFLNPIEQRVKQILKEKKQTHQNRIWGGSHFSAWVRQTFTSSNATTYKRLSVEEKRAFWDRRITLEVVRNIFRWLHPVDIVSAWYDNRNPWRQHMIVCFRVAAHAYFKTQIDGKNPSEPEGCKRQMYATIRGIPNKVPARSGRPRQNPMFVWRCRRQLCVAGR